MNNINGAGAIRFQPAVTPAYSRAVKPGTDSVSSECSTSQAQQIDEVDLNSSAAHIDSEEEVNLSTGKDVPAQASQVPVKENAKESVDSFGGFILYGNGVPSHKESEAKPENISVSSLGTVTMFCDFDAAALPEVGSSQNSSLIFGDKAVTNGFETAAFGLYNSNGERIA